MLASHRPTKISDAAQVTLRAACLPLTWVRQTAREINETEGHDRRQRTLRKNIRALPSDISRLSKAAGWPERCECVV
jgi:hypothetical protein